MKDPTIFALISLALYWRYAKAACLPLTTNSDLCASPPGLTASDGFDDVCNLVSCCLNGSPTSVELPSGQYITCSDVSCANVCSFSQQRVNMQEEACDKTCIPPTASQHEPSYEAGVCCDVEGGTNGIELGCSIDLSYSKPGAPAGCGLSIPLPDSIRLEPALLNSLPRSLQLTVGTGFCCSVNVDASNSECELERSGEIGVGFKKADCSHSGPLRWSAPCSALTSAFTGLNSFPGEAGLLPPTRCDYDGCKGVSCHPPPWQIDPSTGEDSTTTFPSLWNPGVKCASGLFSCCDVAYCRPWCWVKN